MEPSAAMETMTVIFSRVPSRVWCWFVCPLFPITRSRMAAPVWIPVSSAAQMQLGSTSLVHFQRSSNHCLWLVGLAARARAPSREEDHVVLSRSECRRRKRSVHLCPTVSHVGSRALMMALTWSCSRLWLNGKARAAVSSANFKITSSSSSERSFFPHWIPELKFLLWYVG